MTSLTSLSIGPGWILPTVVAQLRQGAPRSREELSMHVSGRTLLRPDVVVSNLKTLHVGRPFRIENVHSSRLRAR
ncbi:hypothetical protein MUN78_02995 [Leucobacter allii]|uniref:Uncharacterized protein n=1 Tax=Leucobacter allii TaxID=2932247 RepID=A0ABY4FNG3_9MICO|nr:hypothetical protein [Leucobacter allii]UOQ57820.1 hypothetical protein MUN78_02995 [Leucobacter allii]